MPSAAPVSESAAVRAQGSEKMALRKAWADTLPFLWTLRQLAIFWVFLLSPWGMLPI